MTICIVNYKTQWRSQDVEAEGQNMLSSSTLLGEMIKHIEGEAQAEDAKRPVFEVEAELKAKPEIEQGRGLGRGLGEPLPCKFLKIHT